MLDGAGKSPKEEGTINKNEVKFEHFDEPLLHSFKHPRIIETDTIVFPSQINRKKEDKSATKTDPPTKKLKVDHQKPHKFQLF